MSIRYFSALLIGAATLALASCGGGERIAFTPAPTPPTPTPTPTPTPAPPPPVAASESMEFATAGSDIRIRWDKEAKVYEVMLPGSAWTSLVPGTDRYLIQDSNGTVLGSAFFQGSGTYQFTGIADFSTSGPGGQIVYGIPTSVSGVPTTGSASYTAELAGSGASYSVGGTAQFNFDFGAGTLTGFMDPRANDPAGWGPYPLGRYVFDDTIYSTGSRSFSGVLYRTDSFFSGGSFSGLFTGPAAQELMGQWKLEFDDIYAPGKTVNAAGVFIGKKGP